MDHKILPFPSLQGALATWQSMGIVNKMLISSFALKKLEFQTKNLKY
jgi:hypothetical protein